MCFSLLSETRVRCLHLFTAQAAPQMACPQPASTFHRRGSSICVWLSPLLIPDILPQLQAFGVARKPTTPKACDSIADNVFEQLNSNQIIEHSGLRCSEFVKPAARRRLFQEHPVMRYVIFLIGYGDIHEKTVVQKAP